MLFKSSKIDSKPPLVGAVVATKLCDFVVTPRTEGDKGVAAGIVGDVRKFVAITNFEAVGDDADVDELLPHTEEDLVEKEELLLLVLWPAAFAICK